jgi:carbon-monoxide dehydrogenase small subunit
MKVSITVNGELRDADVEPRQLLAYFLRDGLGLTGTNIGCDTSSCGSCTVLLDGESAKSCTVLAVQADGCEVVTIGGLAGAARTSGAARSGRTRPVRLNAGLRDGVGLVAEAAPEPTEEEIRHALEGNPAAAPATTSIV